MPQDAIQALDVALKHSAMMSAVLVPVARAFYNPSTAKSLFGGAEVRSRAPLLRAGVPVPLEYLARRLRQPRRSR